MVFAFKDDHLAISVYLKFIKLGSIVPTKAKFGNDLLEPTSLGNRCFQIHTFANFREVTWCM